MDDDTRSPDLSSSLTAASVARRLTEEAGASLRKTKRDKREQHLPVAGPTTWPHEYHALVDAIPMNASSGGQLARVKTDAYVPLEIDHASRTAAVDVVSGAIAPVSETASPLSVGLSNGPDSALPITESMI